MSFAPCSRRRPSLAALIVLSLAAPSVFSQERPPRRRFLDATTPTSDDPRRVPVAPGPRGPEGAIVLTGGRVFDGTGTPPRAASLVIERNRIASVPAPGRHTWPAGTKVIDVGGKTVLPGLIDLHTHLTYVEPGRDPALNDDLSEATLRGVERLRYYVESGITSVRDVASQDSVPFRLKEWVAANRVPGPRVFAAGRLITGTGGHGAEDLRPGSALHLAIREASGPDAWREAVREQFKAGADLIKIASHFSRHEVEAAVDEAHALGIKITCDCETFYVDWAVEAGVDGIEHPLPRSQEAIEAMARKGVWADPTLIPYDYIFDASGGYFDSTSRRFTFSKEQNLEMLRRLRRAGVTIGVGTDLVVDWYRYLPQPYIRELRHLVEAGFSTLEALSAATRTNARILDMADKLGTLEPGKLADVVVVAGRPDEKLEDLAAVDLVIRDGWIVVQDGRVAVPRHVPQPPPRAKSP